MSVRLLVAGALVGSALVAGSVGAANGEDAPASEKPTADVAGQVIGVQQPASKLASQPGAGSEKLTAESPTEDVIAPVAEHLFDIGTGAGFAGQRTDYEHRAITVYWKGKAGDEVRKYIDSKPLGVTITLVEGAKYSREEGNALREKFLASSSAKSLEVVSVSVNNNGSGLTVGVQGSESATSRRTSEATPPAMEDLTFTYAQAPAEGYATRSNDAPPFKGGGRTEYYNGLCSTGFAVLDGSAGRLLTARHCDPAGTHSIRDGGGDTITGTATNDVRVYGPLDTAIIDPTPSPASTYQVYRGGWSASSTRTVHNYYSNWVGDPVCSSGASMGEHCGTVYDDNQAISFNGYTVSVIQVQAPNGSVLAGQGDSGGPMYQILSDGGVQARGLLVGPDSAHSETTSCGTTAPDAGTIRCSKYINYVPISSVLNHWGVSLDVN